MKLRFQIFNIFLLLFFLITFGTLGYHFIEGWSYFDSLYMTVITLSTVGFAEVKPLSYQGKFFTIILIFTGVILITYIINRVISLFFNKEFLQYMRWKHMEINLKSLKDHYVICGYGYVAENVVKKLKGCSKPIVVIEKDKEILAENIVSNVIYVEGDATKYDILKKAGIERANTIIITTSSDVTNLFITISSKHLNPNIKILVRVNEKENIEKFKLSGASEIFSPYTLLSEKISKWLLKPNVTMWLDLVLSDSKYNLTIEELKLSTSSKYIGKPLYDTDIRSKYNCYILAIIDKDKNVKNNPPATTILSSTDTLIVLGTFYDIEKLKKQEHLYDKI